AVNGSDVRAYLDKLKDFELLQNQTGDPYQTIANKLWMKEIMHMSGGITASEQLRFINYLKVYEDSIKSVHYGGNVFTISKTSSDPIQIGLADAIRDRINAGVSVITFFGHSTGNSFDISIDNPANFTNFKRYPVIISNGCFAGEIFDAGRGISGQFIFQENKGAIGFLSTPGSSFDTGLFPYTNTLYRNFGRAIYDMPFGDAMKKTAEDIQLLYANVPSSEIVLSVTEEMIFHGDPYIRVNTHKKPDYCLEAQNVSFVPSNVSVNDASFKIRVIIANLGKAIDVSDSIVLAIDRVFPSGSSVRYEKRVKATYYTDTIEVDIPTGESAAFGLNNFIIKIEDEEKIDELSETNNVLGLQLNILSDDIFPIYPYEFGIVNQSEAQLTLAASTANTFAPVRTYLIQIDTTELFNSSFLKSET